MFKLELLMQLLAYSYSPDEFLNETLEYVVFFLAKIKDEQLYPNFS